MKQSDEEEIRNDQPEHYAVPYAGEADTIGTQVGHESWARKHDDCLVCDGLRYRREF